MNSMTVYIDTEEDPEHKVWIGMCCFVSICLNSPDVPNRNVDVRFIDLSGCIFKLKF